MKAITMDGTDAIMDESILNGIKDPADLVTEYNALLKATKVKGAKVKTFRDAKTGRKAIKDLALEAVAFDPNGEANKTPMPDLKKKKEPTVPRERKLSASKIIQDGLLAKMPDEKILTDVKAKMPDSKADKSHVAWYRTKLRKEGKLQSA